MFFFHCLFLCLSFWQVTPYPIDRLPTCVAVAEEAEEQGVPGELVIALAYVESRFNPDVVSRSGAVGPMQVLPKYACEDGVECDHIVAGVLMLRRWARRAYFRHGRRKVQDRDALAMYHGGNNPGPQSFKYADRILRLQKQLKKKDRRIWKYKY